MCADSSPQGRQINFLSLHIRLYILLKLFPAVTLQQDFYDLHRFPVPVAVQLQQS